jgi:hypothetical protein
VNIILFCFASVPQRFRDREVFSSRFETSQPSAFLAVFLWVFLPDAIAASMIFKNKIATTSGNTSKHYNG